MLTILGLTMLAGGILFEYVSDWSATWDAWLVAAPPNGAGLDSQTADFFGLLPTLMIISYVCACVALASPVALRVSGP